MTFCIIQEYLGMKEVKPTGSAAMLLLVKPATGDIISAVALTWTAGFTITRLHVDESESEILIYMEIVTSAEGK